MLINEVASRIQSRLAQRANHIRQNEAEMNSLVFRTKVMVAAIDNPVFNQDEVHKALLDLKQRKAYTRAVLTSLRKQQKLDKENLKAVRMYEQYLRLLNMKKH